MPLTQADILKALETVKYPGYSRNIVSFGLVKEIHAHEGHAVVTLELTTQDSKITEALKAAVTEALAPFEKEAHIELQLNTKEPAAPPAPAAPERVAGIRRAIAVASGKGGVGKTTVAVNLAYALARTDAKVGILDCDIYGPTVPLMLGAGGEPLVEDGKLVPFRAHGMAVMSMGLLIDENAPVVWRGPMITKAIRQFIADVRWGELDFLVIDLPPGTGDAQLTLAQTVALDGVIVVTTPQVAASRVAIRGAQMFNKLSVPIVGVVENMSYYSVTGEGTKSANGKKDFVFGQGGGEATAKALGAPLLAQLPIDSQLRERADRGEPILAVTEKSESAKLYRSMAEAIRSKEI